MSKLIPRVEVDISKQVTLPAFKHGVHFFIHHCTDVTDEDILRALDDRLVLLVWDTPEQARDMYFRTLELLKGPSDYVALMSRKEGLSFEYQKQLMIDEYECTELSLAWGRPPAGLNRGKE